MLVPFDIPKILSSHPALVGIDGSVPQYSAKLGKELGLFFQSECVGVESNISYRTRWCPHSQNLRR